MDTPYGLIKRVNGHAVDLAAVKPVGSFAVVFARWWQHIAAQEPGHLFARSTQTHAHSIAFQFSILPSRHDGDFAALIGFVTVLAIRTQ